MENNIFYKNLLIFLNENKNDYFQNLLNENSQYKILYDSMYSCLEILSKKLPKDDNCLNNLFEIFNKISYFENSFLYLQGFRDCYKLNKFIDR